MKKVSLIFYLLIGFGCISYAQTVTIGAQVWMAKNLDVSYFKNVDPIPEAKTDEEWQEAGNNKQPAWCYYDNDPANGDKYGKLYNHYAVTDSRGLCPTGWHVPSDSEWTTLENHLGGSSVAGRALKSKGWNPPNTGATNSSGFTALPGGRRYDFGGFFYMTYYGRWWSSSVSAGSSAWGRGLNYDSSNIYRAYSGRTNGFSVRCCRD